MQLLPLRQGFPSKKASTLPLLLQLDPEVPQDPNRPAMDLCLVIDRSSSMQGTPLQVACEAAVLAVAGLQEADQVSVVIYDNEVDVLVRLQHPTDKDAITKKIKTVAARGSTALFPGWETGATELAGEGNGIKRVLLLTDGEANVGLQNPDEIAQHVAAASRRGVQTTTLGFGKGYNENLLRAMAASGNGNHYFVERSGQLADFFNLELAGLESTLGVAVELKAETHVDGVKIHLLQDLPVTQRGTWRLSDLLAGAQMLLLLEAEIPELPAGLHKLATLHLTWTAPRSGERESREFVLELAAMQVGFYETLAEHEKVREQLALRDVALAQKEASEALNQGNKVKAEAALDRGVQRLDGLKGSQSVVLSRQLKSQIAQIKAGEHQVAAKKMTQQYYGSLSSVSLTTTPFFKPRARARQLVQLAAEGSFPVRLRDDLAKEIGYLLKIEAAEHIWDRVRGMLLGVALGDSLGASTRQLQPADRRANYSQIGDYVSTKGTRTRGGPSDLTRLTFWSLEAMVLEGDFEPEVVAEALSRRAFTGGGEALKGFIENMGKSVPWTRAGVTSAGNGALVRIPAVVASRLFQRGALFVDSILFAGLTHRDSAALSSAAAFGQMLYDLLRLNAPPSAAWWWESYVEHAAAVETDHKYSSRAGGSSTLSAFVQQQLPQAYQADQTVEEACRHWGSGSYLMETVPSALYILARHADDPEQAMLRAVNDTVDNAAIAALVGAALGALHGDSCFPRRWVDENDFRTGADDQGAVLRILDQAANLFMTPQI